MTADDTPRITFLNGRKIINAPKLPQAPQINQGETRKLSKRRIVDDRSTWYEKRAPTKPAGTFTLDND